MTLSFKQLDQGHAAPLLLFALTKADLQTLLCIEGVSTKHGSFLSVIRIHTALLVETLRV